MEDGAQTRAGDRRVAVRLALAFLLLFALFQRGHFSGTDELGLFQMTRSLYVYGSLAVPPFVHTAGGLDGRRYSHFSVGQSALAVPFYALGSLARGGTRVRYCNCLRARKSAMDSLGREND